MNNLISIRAGREVHQWLGNLWRSAIIREASQRDVWLRDMLGLYAAYPRVFFSMDNFRVEKAHFTGWMGAVSFRHYENPVLHDLYYLHEIAHAVHMEYQATWPSFEAWQQKMVDNENLASLTTEVLVYQHIPGLREQTFPFETWADRFLGLTTPRTIAQLLEERRLAITQPQDDIEQRMAWWAHQNQEWCRIWRDRYQEVEAFMNDWTARIPCDKSARELEQWLRSKCEPGRPYPFPDEAEAFAEVYWANPAGHPTTLHEVSR